MKRPPPASPKYDTNNINFIESISVVFGGDAALVAEGVVAGGDRNYYDIQLIGNN